MPRKFIVIAGPQAAGKSSVKGHIAGIYNQYHASYNKYSRGYGLSAVVPLEEARSIVIHKHQIKGAISMSYLDELEVIHTDMGRMLTIMRDDDDRIFLDECNVFTLAHANAHGIDITEGFYKQYCDMLQRLNTGMIFLDVPPDVSWERRKSRYEERHWKMPFHEKAKVMKAHRDYMDDLYPRLCEMYESLDFPKAKIDANAPLDSVKKEVEETFRKLVAEAGSH